MRLLRSLLSAGIVAAAVAPVIAQGSSIGPDPNETSFFFFGNCEDCAAAAGVASFPVTAELVLFRYEEGTPINDEQFVLFSYSGSNLLDPYVVFRSVPGEPPPPPPVFHGLGSISGSITVGGLQELELRFGDGLLFQLSGGNWFTCGVKDDLYYAVPCIQPTSQDFGTGSFTNTPVIPVPPAIVLLASGLAGLGAITRRTHRYGRVRISAASGVRSPGSARHQCLPVGLHGPALRGRVFSRPVSTTPRRASPPRRSAAPRGTQG